MNFKQIARYYFPLMFLVALGLALLLTITFDEPLTYLQTLLAGDWYIVALIAYGLFTMLSVVIAPITMAPTIPFAAKIFGATNIFITVLLAWVVGALVLFYLARQKTNWLDQIIRKREYDEYEEKLPNKLDLWSLLVLRLFSPVDLLSVVAAVRTKITSQVYVITTLFGLVPLAFVLSFSADAISDNNPLLLFLFLFLVLMIGLGYMLFESHYFAKKPAVIVTHSGKFHTDDVFAVATIISILKQSKRRYKVIRTRDEATLEKYKQLARESKPEDMDVFVMDIGASHEPQYNIFDHHQNGGAGARENGIEYASFGLVWKRYGIRITGNQELVDYVDQKFVINIDAPDNGVETWTLTHEDLRPIELYDIVEKYYKPKQDTIEDFDSRFNEAVQLAQGLLQRVVGYGEDKLQMKIKAGQYYAQAENKQIIILDEFISAGEFGRFEDVLFVVSPDKNKKWQILAVTEDEDHFAARQPFPKEWWGLRDEALQDVSGVKDAVFCHRSGNFLCVAQTKEGAIEMAQKTLNP